MLTEIGLYFQVREYKQHWWKCTGPCQHRPPFYGMVKRAMNRAPAPRDLWWDEHRRTCDGHFVKVKEPDGYKDKKKRGKKTENGSVLQGDGPLPKLLKKGKQDGVLDVDANCASRIEDHFEKLTGGHRLCAGPEEKDILSTSSSGLPFHCQQKNVGDDDNELVTIGDTFRTCTHRLLNCSSAAKPSACVDDSESGLKWSLSLSGKQGTSSSVASTENSCGSSHLNTSTVAAELSTAMCPVCGQEVPLNDINRHLDLCLTNS